jgi:molybdate transport system substrate-binding protein
VLCGGAQAAPRKLTVSAAASLTDVLPSVAAAWKQQGGVEIDFNFDASSKLAAQIANGAPADLFISADADWFDFLARKDLIEGSTRVDLLTNVLVAVVPTDSKQAIRRPEDISLQGVKRLALAGENVPAGKYARESLMTLGLWKSVESRVVNGANVRQTLELAARGDVEAALVYRTDALAEPRVRIAFDFASTSHHPIVYPAGVVRDAGHAKEAAAFLVFCRTETARRLFASAGFGLPTANH